MWARGADTISMGFLLRCTDEASAALVLARFQCPVWASFDDDTDVYFLCDARQEGAVVRLSLYLWHADVYDGLIITDMAIFADREVETLAHSLEGVIGVDTSFSDERTWGRFPAKHRVHMTPSVPRSDI